MKDVKKNINQDEFKAILKKEFDETIILSESDETFRMLINSKGNDTGNAIRNIMPETDCKLFEYYFREYQGHSYYFSFVRSFSGMSDVLWMVDAVIDVNIMSLRGRRIDRKNDVQLSQYDIENDSEIIMNNYIIACGRIKFLDECTVFSDINDNLAILLNRKRISRECLTESYMFRNCCHHRASAVGLIKYVSEPENMNYHYIAGYYPLVVNGKVSEIQLFVIPFDSAGLINEDVTGLLTPRENTILRLSAEGMTIPEISASLNISDYTARTILYNSFRKINVSSKSDAILKFYGLSK